MTEIHAVHDNSSGTFDASAAGSPLQSALDAQRRAFLADGQPNAALRIDRIDRVIDLILSNADELVEAMRVDYGHRSPSQSLLFDVSGPLPGIKHTRKNVKRWMKPTRQSAGPLRPLGGKAWIDWQPLGVVGVVSPWNFPVCLTFDPVAQAFAAGNRVMVKLSELVPETSEILRREIAARFDPEELIAFTGGVEVGREFSSLDLDHILVTGSPNTGRAVQSAAGANLTPVTLELGGKCPVVVSRSADLAKACRRVMTGKMFNVGQLCLTPDYLQIPAGSEALAVDHLRRTATSMFPTLIENPDYSSVINEANHRRLQSLLSDARDKGARILEINPAAEDFGTQEFHKIPPTIVLDTDETMRITQEEIFGPILVVREYRDVADAVSYINRRPKPLAAYYFGPEDSERRYFLDNVYSGGVTINDVTLHYTVPGMPFGGVGESGSGYYHGRSGFETFSHARGVLDAPRGISPLGMFAAPYGGVKMRVLKAQVDFERRSVARRLGKGR